VSTGGRLRYYPVESKGRKSTDGVLSVSLATAVGFGTGLLAGLVLGEWLGDVHPERVRRIFSGRAPKTEPVDPGQVEREVLRAFKNTSATRRLNLGARAMEGGVIELTGIAPDERTRLVAGEAAATVHGADIVVNRILVQGRDVPPGHTAPPA
jgi:hypothetical protein